MIKLLLISLLVFSTATAQITTNFVSSSSDFTPRTTMPFSVNLTAGKPMIMFIGSQSTTSTPPIPTLTSSGYTWFNIATVSFTNNTSRFIRLTAFVVYPETDVTGLSCTADFSGATQSWTGWLQYRVGSGNNVKVYQSIADSANGSNPSFTLATLQGNNNSVIVGLLNDKNPFNGVAEAGWTEDADGGGGTAGTNAVGRYGVHRDNHSDNTVSITSPSAKSVGIAIELRTYKWVFTQ